MIMPVWLHHKESPEREVMTYALLDKASDTTFIKLDILRNLGLNGPEIKLSLFTMLGREEISIEKMSGLVVQWMDKRVKIELPKTYSRSKIPSRRDQIPTREVANKWPHLKKIANKLFPYQSNMEVGLLLGCNCQGLSNLEKSFWEREMILMQ